MLGKVKDVYLLWHSFRNTIPKTQRYSLGQKVDDLFAETIEAIATAAFLTRDQKIPYVRRAIQKVDVLKIFLMILWEAQALDNKKYIALSLPIDEIGTNLGGWSGQLTKQNSPQNRGEK
ncbi:MAG: hypothetical protein UY09_C0029G0008 [Parcubacteria group bacterium GW2011_GWA2_47_8]|nr:MAG: hypothetical protein UY09_C0029G0008 [Parcubacteria group bacterium GW2011_GWA2_47_8]